MAYTKTILAAASALVLFAAVPALALSVSTDLGSNANVNVGSGVTVNVNAQSDANASSNSATDTGANASGSTALPIVITQADVAATTSQGAQVVADNVQTSSQLTNFISAKLRGDANLSSVDTASDHVAVTYQEPAELFGFIPVGVGVTATTDAYGNVSVTSPWWAFLASSDETNLQAGVQTAVNGVLGTSASSGADLQLSTSQQAKLVTAIETAMAAHANATANASGSVNTT